MNTELIKRKLISKSFEYVVEQDFNPDFVLYYGVDCFDKGMLIGMVVGSGLALLTIGVLAGLTAIIIGDTESIQTKGDIV